MKKPPRICLIIFAIFFLIMAYGTESQGVSNFAMFLAITNLVIGTLIN